MQLEYLLTELLQVHVRLKGERILHRHECLHECLHSFQHFQVYKKIIHQHGEVEDLINKRGNKNESPEEFVNFNKLCCTSDNTSSFKLDFFQFHNTVVAYSCPIGHQHTLIKSEGKQSR